MENPAFFNTPKTLATAYSSNVLATTHNAQATEQQCAKKQKNLAIA